MHRARILNAAGRTEEFFYETGPLELDFVSSTRLVFVAEIVDGRLKGETVRIVAEGENLDPRAPSGRVDAFRQSVDGDLHFRWDLDDPVPLARLASGRFPTLASGVDFRGNRFDNRFRADRGDDLAIGGEGDDSLFGLGGDDVLRGESEGDLLRGGAGANQLFGGRGGDRLVATGERRDLLDAGPGDDVFLLKAGAASSKRARDVIDDFHEGDDRIGFGADYWDRNRDPAWRFVGDDRFSGRALELRYNGEVLSGDDDGDRQADFRVEIANGADLTEDSFLF